MFVGDIVFIHFIQITFLLALLFDVRKLAISTNCDTVTPYI